LYDYNIRTELQETASNYKLAVEATWLYTDYILYFSHRLELSVDQL